MRNLYLFLMVPLILHGSFITAEPQDSKDDHNTTEQKRIASLDVMRRRAMALTVATKVAGNVSMTPIIENPLLRYSNPAAQVVTPDATVWGWGRQGRPLALASIEDLGCEIVSLAEQPVSATAKSGLKWSSDAAGLKWNKLPESFVPAETPTLRARQMKEISQKFSATGHYGTTEKVELRLLVRPLHRYADPTDGLVDGSLFAFVAGTNPEVILLIECRSSDAGDGSNRNHLDWNYAFTRLSAGELEARLEDKVVWTCPGVGSWINTAPYFSFKFAPDDIVPVSEVTSRKQ